ncbi:hypothetical protein [Acidithiobacillus thiooxidans]|uniref:Uncharacterized protein n=1 Tax=Acidithiobacillus thiooxidans TaxID=930 RepID=A0A1C2I9G0_ACITH|nr:hypothetical protein [Acidithiobacillus thiooxidans]OCX72613.1 hypothetical protein A6M23_09560 [Acidithiobacillus thiooxidans]OCX85017.1 hypothetical protein A6P08_08350 [Acidithiobacillus thiooxidans]
MSKIQTRIQSADMQAISNIATQKGLKLSTVLDAVIQAGLNEIQSAQRYELLQTGILLVRDRDQDASRASRRTQRASTSRSKPVGHKARAQERARSNADSQQTATNPQAKPQTPEPAASPQTAATPQAQSSVPANTPVPPFLTGEMIPAEIYKDLTEYEKECLSLEAFLLSPDGRVVLRNEPPIASDGTRIPAGTWRILYTSFFPGDDLDNFVGLTWKIKDK